MAASNQGQPAVPARTTVERTSDVELVVTRVVNGPRRIVFEAWTKPELFQQWWAPRSFGVSLISYDADVRTGGAYRAVIAHHASEQPMLFFGRYIEVTPHSRLVWTNDEGGEGGAVTTVSFEERSGATLIVVHERYSSKRALDDALASGSTSGWSEQFSQLDELIVTFALDGVSASIQHVSRPERAAAQLPPQRCLGEQCVGQ